MTDLATALIAGLGGAAGASVLTIFGQSIAARREERARFIVERRDAYLAFTRNVSAALNDAGSVAEYLGWAPVPDLDNATQPLDIIRSTCQTALDHLAAARPHREMLQLLAGTRARAALNNLDGSISQMQSRLHQTRLTGKPAHVVTPGSLGDHVGAAQRALDALLAEARADVGNRDPGRRRGS